MEGILTRWAVDRKTDRTSCQKHPSGSRPMTQTVRPAPRRRGWPVVGATFAYIRDPLRMMQEQYAACGPVSEINFVGGNATVLLGPDACGAALVNKDKAFANGPGWGEVVGPFFDRGLMLLDFA